MKHDPEPGLARGASGHAFDVAHYASLTVATHHASYRLSTAAHAVLGSGGDGRADDSDPQTCELINEPALCWQRLPR